MSNCSSSTDDHCCLQNDELILQNDKLACNASTSTQSIQQQEHSIDISPDKWDNKMKSKYISISSDGLIIKNNIPNIYRSTFDEWRSIFGTKIISKSGKYKWNFEIISIDDYTTKNEWKLIIGIIKDEYIYNKLEEIFINTQDIGIGIGFIGGESTIKGGISMEGTESYGINFDNVGDKLTMILDLDNNILSYTINGQIFGPVDLGGNFKLNKNDKYRLAVSLCSGRTLKMYN